MPLEGFLASPELEMHRRTRHEELLLRAVFGLSGRVCRAAAACVILLGGGKPAAARLLGHSGAGAPGDSGCDCDR